MLKSSKPVPRKRCDGTEDTEDREVRGATGGEKPPKARSPWTEPARNKAGRQMRKEASRECETPRTQRSWDGKPSVLVGMIRK